MSQPAALLIDRLNLSLPAEFQARSNAIARETVSQLGGLNVDRDVRIASLNVPPLSLAGGESDRVIGRRIAGAIRRQLLSPGAGVVRPVETNGVKRNAD